MEKLSPEYVEFSHIDALCLGGLLRAVAENRPVEYYKDEAERFLRIIHRQMEEPNSLQP